MCQQCEHHHGGDCGCEGRGSKSRCGCGEFGREGHVHLEDQTRAEQISDLETHMDALKSEIQAIEERLTDLRK